MSLKVGLSSCHWRSLSFIFIKRTSLVLGFDRLCLYYGVFEWPFMFISKGKQSPIHIGWCMCGQLSNSVWAWSSAERWIADATECRFISKSVETSSMYRKVASSGMSRLVRHFKIFRRLMKGKFDVYVLWPVAKKFQNWIVDRSTAGNFTVCKQANIGILSKGVINYFFESVGQLIW